MAIVEVQRLREATEDDVQAALADSYLEDDLAGVERAKLLEFSSGWSTSSLGMPGD